MARPAPSVSRTVKLLDYLAARPGERYALSDIARRLGFNKATCHAMLNELVDAGALVRDPTAKTYGLGPTLVTWGMAAAFDATRALEVAEPEMDRLREELDASCVARALVGHHTVVLARRDTDRPVAAFVPIGHRVPAVPPVAAEFVAWSDEASVRDWLDRVAPPVDDAALVRHRQLLDEVRSQGYRLVCSDAAELDDLLDALRRSSEEGEHLDDTLDELLARLERRRSEPARRTPSIVGVTAPVFGANGRPVLCLSLSGFGRSVLPAGTDVPIRALVEACRRITEGIGGRFPDRPGAPEAPDDPVGAQRSRRRSSADASASRTRTRAPVRSSPPA